MKRIFLASLLIAIILITAACVPPPGPGVRGVPLPPPLFFPAPPLLAFWPDYDIYVCVNISSDLIFYRGAWYRIHGDKWYRGRGHTGPWKWVPPGQMPKSFRGLPGNFRNQVKGHPRIKHRDMERSWRKWERDRKDNRKSRRNERPEKERLKKERLKKERLKKEREQEKKEMRLLERRRQQEEKKMEREEKDEDRKKKWQNKKKYKKNQDNEENDRKRGGRGKKNR